MPIYKTIHHNNKTKILIWKIDESLTDLFQGIELNKNSTKRLNGMKSELHKRGFLSIRHLLKTEGYNDYDLYYNKFGKPFLTDGKHISITHSFNYAAIIISNYDVGIDIEKNREKIIRIYNRFVNTEVDSLSNEDFVKQLTVIWGAKESMYKTYPYGGLSFYNHIAVDPFLFVDKKTKGKVNYKDWQKSYDVFFQFLEDEFTLVYVLPV